MLTQFSVKNYKSIKNEVVLDLQATSIKENVDTLIHGKDGLDYLPLSVIYGPNGGGKSNILEAILVFWFKIVTPVLIANIGEDVLSGKGEIKPVVPFAFDEESKNSPTEFVVFFQNEFAEYRYELIIKNNSILYECLDRVKFSTKRRSSLFERNGEDIELKGDFLKLKISQGISDTMPLVSYLGIMYNNNDIVSDVINGLTFNIIILDYGDPRNEYNFTKTKFASLKPVLLKMLEAMDIDIKDIETDPKNDDEICTKHIVGGIESKLNLHDESSGTRKILGMLPYFLITLQRGKTLIIDELDAKIHPALLRYLIELFNDKTVNKHGAQLIFTSHDLTTMTSEIFRRDEIWFAAKGKNEDTDLYSLVEFKNEDGKGVRSDAKYDKQYLEGRYGADPYLKRMVDWEVFDGEQKTTMEE